MGAGTIGAGGGGVGAAARGEPARRFRQVAHHQQGEQRRHAADEKQVLPAQRGNDPAPQHRSGDEADLVWIVAYSANARSSGAKFRKNVTRFELMAATGNLSSEFVERFRSEVGRRGVNWEEPPVQDEPPPLFDADDSQGFQEESAAACTVKPTASNAEEISAIMRAVPNTRNGPSSRSRRR